MSIRRTRQQKMHAEMRREESAIRYQPTEKSPTKSPTPKMTNTLPEQKFFLMDLQKTAVSTVVVLLLLAFAFWSLR